MNEENNQLNRIIAMLYSNLGATCKWKIRVQLGCLVFSSNKSRVVKWEDLEGKECSQQYV